MIIYIGYFLEKQEASVAGWKEISNQHITLAFRPNQQQIEKMFKLPEEIKVKIAGYGHDEYNEGYLIKNDMIENLVKIPHITLAVNNGGKPVNTGKLSFEEIPQKEIVVHLGYFSDDGKVYIIK